VTAPLVLRSIRTPPSCYQPVVAPAQEQQVVERRAAAAVQYVMWWASQWWAYSRESGNAHRAR
jgi:hypothetical protein